MTFLGFLFKILCLYSVRPFPLPHPGLLCLDLFQHQGLSEFLFNKPLQSYLHVVKPAHLLNFAYSYSSWL